MADVIREPKQQRSIEKKRKIIEAGYELFAEKGYFNTNTAEIAKRAGVSTGIVYGYFHDKRDIMLDVLDIYIESVFSPIIALFDNVENDLDIKTLASVILDKVVETHKKNAAIHEALHSLTSTDKIVDTKFRSLEGEMTNKITDTLIKHGYSNDYLLERVHTSINIFQAYAHEAVFDNHTYIDYVKMREIVINIIEYLFK